MLSVGLSERRKTDLQDNLSLGEAARGHPSLLVLT